MANRYFVEANTGEGWTEVPFTPLYRRCSPWCGETVLFNDIKAAHDKRRAEVKAFNPGDEVTLVINGNKETAYVVKSNSSRG